MFRGDEPVKKIDDALGIMQKLFNVESNSYNQVISTVRNLESYYRNSGEVGNIAGTVHKLSDSIDDIKIVKSGEMFKRVKGLDPFGKDIIKASDKLIQDITSAQDWLSSYEKMIEDVYSTSSRNEIAINSLESLGVAILGRAIELCPKDTGRLRKSGFVSVLSDSVVIGFTAPYSVYVHENMAQNFKVGRAKFLEIALSEFLTSRKTWIDIIDKRIFVEIGLDYKQRQVRK